MAFKGDTAEQESLQCLACAAYQKLGDKLDITTLRRLMVQGKFKSTKHDDNDIIWDNVGITDRVKRNLSTWAHNPQGEAFLDKWLNSSIWVAKSLKVDNIYSGNNYKFYRVDQFPGKGTHKDFKETFGTILKNIKDAANGQNLGDFADTVKIYADKNIKLAPDKWNPADFVAVNKTDERKWEDIIENFVTNIGDYTTLTDDLENFLLKQKAERTQAKVEILKQMAILYEYNKTITAGVVDKEFIPISLKLTEQENPGVSFSKVSEPADVAKYFKLRVEYDKDFEYKPNTQEAKAWFSIKGVSGMGGKYSFTMRAGASVEKLTGDVTNELKDLGVASAQAGKIAYSVSTKIAKLSGGRGGFTTLNKKRKELWKKYTPPGMKNPTKGVFWKHTVSKTHGFTSWRVFDTLATVHNANLQRARAALVKQGKELTREQLGFDVRISEKGRPRRADIKYIMNEDPTGIVNDIKMWAEYAEWLSDGDTTMKDFMENALGKRQWAEVLKAEVKEKAKPFNPKKPERSQPDWRYNITLSQVQMKYMKFKIQAYEQAWLIDPKATTNTLPPKVKEDILKGMWMYAASKGFVIFKKNTVSAYLLSGAFIKCAA